MAPSAQGRNYEFRCFTCGAEQEGFGYTCRVCQGPLLACLGSLTARPEPRPAPGLWRWRDVLPRTTATITLGEANTPTFPIAVDGSAHRVHVKLESLNPTLSFKDRALALGTSWAADNDLPGLVVASTGNAAVSASAYAAAAGLRCRVLVGTASRAGAKLDACRALGASVEEIDGDYSDAYRSAIESERRGWLNVSTTYRNPLLAEAYRSIAFELLADLEATPDLIVVPIGAGPLLRGISQGFHDAVALGLADRHPAMIGVQAASVAPIAQAWHRRHRARWPLPSDARPTVATAIADGLRGYESHGHITLAAIEDSDGAAIAVTDEAIESSSAQLASQGIWVEPSSATAHAAMAMPAVQDRPACSVVLILTGHGIKSGAVHPH